MIQSNSDVFSLKDDLLVDFATYTSPFKDFTKRAFSYDGASVRLYVAVKLAAFALQQDCFPSFLNKNDCFAMFIDHADVYHVPAADTNFNNPTSACFKSTLSMLELKVPLLEVVDFVKTPEKLCTKCSFSLTSRRAENKTLLSEAAVCGLIKLMSFAPFFPSLGFSSNVTAEVFSHFWLSQFSNSKKGAYTSFAKTTSLVADAKKTVKELEVFWHSNAAFYLKQLTSCHDFTNGLFTKESLAKAKSAPGVEIHAVQSLPAVKTIASSFLTQVFAADFVQPKVKFSYSYISDVSFLILPYRLFNNVFLDSVFAVHSFGGMVSPSYAADPNFLETAWALHASSGLSFKKAVSTAVNIFKPV